MDVFLYNPRSKKNTGEKHIKKITKKWKNSFKTYNVLEINKIQLIETLSPKDRIIIVGGDGTVHHFADDLKNYDLKQDAYLIPSGTGNDFRKSIKTKEKMVKLNKYLKDLPRVTFDDCEQVFVNGCGLGLDGYVCSLVNSKKSKGFLAFFRATLKGFLSYKKKDITVTVDGKEYEFKKVFLASIMNGTYEGGGMKMSPKSDRLDDEIEICVIHSLSKLRLFFAFPLIYFGKHIWLRKRVKILKGKEISVASNEGLFMQIDGEDYANIKKIDTRR